MQGRASLDDAPFSAFHRRIAIYSCGGPFCDGYILGIIAAALGPLSSEIGLTAGWQGMVGAAALVGMFVGGLVFGYLTDLLGRRVMYSADLLVLIVASAAQFWVHDRVSLLVLRFVLGLAVGADYPIASALLSEFAPKRQRGMLLAAMIGAWWLGYTISFIAGYALGNEGLSWRWMLASSAIPAALVSLLRWGTPESPRWLISKGRTGEAQALIQRHIGSGYGLQESPSAKTAYRTIFRGPYLGRTAFVCVFWSCQVVPTFAIYTFAPDLLRAFGSPDPAFGAAILSLFFLAGVIPAVLLIDRIGRRPVLTIPFAVTGVTLLLLGWLPRGSSILVEMCFILFAIFNAGSSVLQWVYPSELFPTEVRMRAAGICNTFGRGATILTPFIVVALFRSYRVKGVLGFLIALLIVQILVVLRFGVEPKKLRLEELDSTVVS